jgi:hypothetical protein
VDKICDTIASTGSRRTHATVYLENLRCDGSGHDGCQAGCNLYWTEAWLRRVDDDLCHPAETLTHARMLRVRAGLPYPIGPPDVFAMTVPAGPRAAQRLVLVSVAVDASNGSAAKLENLAQAGRGRCVRSEATGPRFWRCRATEAFNASEPPEDLPY